MKSDETFDVTGKARIYHILAQMSLSFSSIIRYCEDLETAGALTGKYRHLFQAFTIEVQGELDLQVLEHMDGVETEDWARGGRVREKWEKYLRFEDEQEPNMKKPHKTQRPSPRKRTGSDASK